MHRNYFSVVTCDNLSIENGRVNYRNVRYASDGKKEVDTVANNICDEGYYASVAQSTCTTYGVWNPPNPTCIPSNESSILV